VTGIGARLRSIPSWQLTLGLALLGLGFLIAAQLAAEAPRVRYTTQERSPLIETALGLQVQQEGLKTRILQLRDQLQALELAGQGSAAQVRELNEELERASSSSSTIPSSRPAPPGTTSTTSSAPATSGRSSRRSGSPGPRPSR
jgi:hypothetical protein